MTLLDSLTKGLLGLLFVPERGWIMLRLPQCFPVKAISSLCLILVSQYHNIHLLVPFEAPGQFMVPTDMYVRSTKSHA